MSLISPNFDVLKVDELFPILARCLFPKLQEKALEQVYILAQAAVTYVPIHVYKARTFYWLITGFFFQI